ncbi:alpha/beta hydrolase-fold protein [Hymenobacter sp. BT770]|uniref:alpha/beta hydrolase-fold protein n=1 Tax=Hymenobacter sp. BT770 TaxID=2886942 RepID=UPI001D10CD5B|nr:alpha/beta hydrolase-fold protein [Hymenobacter sp. BT770]MCC3151828.1 T9SS type A sorting domain-containing protein [Hymenobacter sp. BT770]MDO3413550.1 alpha/beta hydrolase-fold protein [Hymenobacter sp. BT770]
MKKLFSFIFTLLAFAAHAQVTFKITAVPANTPANATIYIAGTFNAWNPASAAHALTRDATDGSYQITLPASTGTIEYKFTRGSWAAVETNATNGSVPNRTYTFGSSTGSVLHQVLNWEDLAGGTPGGGQSTAAANVSVISTTFQIPQLGRTRRVWLYLPPGYATSGRRYPVLYMQDGQNVFDNLTAFAGEWGVDETLNLLQSNGQDPTGCIVVAIDNGPNRLDEYSPWNNPQYGGGQGDLYVDFLVQTLKPYIDANYRTLTSRENTGVAGSSMGALIATYAALRYPAVFGKVGVFSPAYWFAAQPLFDYVHQHPANPSTRFYFVSGTTESTTMVPQMTAMRDSLLRGGVPAANLNFNTRADGQHAEWFWKREFPAAYSWLFAPATATATRKSQRLAASVYPNPAAQELRIELPPALAAAQLEISDARGRTVLKTAVHNGQTVNLRGLAHGLYLSRIVAGQEMTVVKFAKE